MFSQSAESQACQTLLNQRICEVFDLASRNCSQRFQIARQTFRNGHRFEHQFNKSEKKNSVLLGELLNEKLRKLEIISHRFPGVY